MTKTEKMEKEAAILLELLLHRNRKELVQVFRDGEIYMTEDGGEPKKIGSRERKLIADFEAQGSYKVYHVVKGGVDGVGYCVNLLYVGGFEEDYPLMETQADRRFALAYVYNATYPENSESGFIELSESLRRIA